MTGLSELARPAVQFTDSCWNVLLSPFKRRHDREAGAVCGGVSRPELRSERSAYSACAVARDG